MCFTLGSADPKTLLLLPRAAGVEEVEYLFFPWDEMIQLFAAGYLGFGYSLILICHREEEEGNQSFETTSGLTSTHLFAYSYCRQRELVNIAGVEWLLSADPLLVTHSMPDIALDQFISLCSRHWCF